MKHLTRITEPFGLLDKETQRELISARNLCEKFQVYGDVGWEDCQRPPDYLLHTRVYRLKPKPETVTVYGFSSDGGRWSFGARDQEDTHFITFALDENGDPDCSKPAKVEKL